MIDSKLVRKIFIKTGTKMRTLYTYSSDGEVLRQKHEAYLSFINKHFIPPTFSHAYTKNRSIFTNAKVHMYNDVFIKIDVENFFPSLNHGYLMDQMTFELNRRNLHSILKIECKSIIDNCTISDKGIPLGFIVSPTLSNIYMKKFDGIFYGKLKRLQLEGMKYTRYADDIFVSFKNAGVDTSNNKVHFEQIVKICEQELTRCHLKINRKKTKFINLDRSNHSKLAGVNIVKKDNDYRTLTVSRNTIKDLYFRSMRLHSEISANNKSKDKEIRNREIRSIKGMHSFVISIHKNGYSDILSSVMKNSITELGYKSLEDMISKMSVKD